MVVQHTGCGLHGEEERLRGRVAEATSANPPWPLGALEILRSTPHLVEGHSARGLVYEVETGRLREVR